MGRAYTNENITADTQLVTGRCYLTGISVRENAGTPAVAAFVLRDGTSTSGTGRVFIELAANESRGESFGPQGLPFINGVFLDMESGEIDISLQVL